MTHWKVCVHCILITIDNVHIQAIFKYLLTWIEREHQKLHAHLICEDKHNISFTLHLHQIKYLSS